MASTPKQQLSHEGWQRESRPSGVIVLAPATIRRRACSQASSTAGAFIQIKDGEAAVDENILKAESEAPARRDRPK